MSFQQMSLFDVGHFQGGISVTEKVKAAVGQL